MIKKDISFLHSKMETSLSLIEKLRDEFRPIYADMEISKGSTLPKGTLIWLEHAEHIPFLLNRDYPIMYSGEDIDSYDMVYNGSLHMRGKLIKECREGNAETLRSLIRSAKPCEVVPGTYLFIKNVCVPILFKSKILCLPNYMNTSRTNAAFFMAQREEICKIQGEYDIILRGGIFYDGKRECLFKYMKISMYIRRSYGGKAESEGIHSWELSPVEKDENDYKVHINTDCCMSMPCGDLSMILNYVRFVRSPWFEALPKDLFDIYIITQ